jgi:hypothetical protein
MIININFLSITRIKYQTFIYILWSILKNVFITNILTIPTQYLSPLHHEYSHILE